MKSNVINLLLMGSLFIPGLAVADESEPFMAEDSEIGVTEAFVERDVRGSYPYFQVLCRYNETGKPVFDTLPSATMWVTTLGTPINELQNLGQFVDINADGFVDFIIAYYYSATSNYYRATFINRGGDGWIMDKCQTNFADSALGMLFASCNLLTPNPGDTLCQ